MSYDSGYPFTDEVTAFLVIYLIFVLVLIGFSIASYVLNSLGMYTIAKRRQINHPWMAWVPGLDFWILGSISDQYQYLTQGKNKNKRKWLVGLYIAYFVVFIIYYIVMLVFIATMVSDSMGAAESEMVAAAIGFIIAFIVGWLVLMGTIIAMVVIRYIALYDLYKSCNPGNATLFLVLSILVSVTEPFLVFSCRKKDQGFSTYQPRPKGYIPEQPAYQPQPEAYQPPVYQQPTACQPETVAEPVAQEASQPEKPWEYQ